MAAINANNLATLGRLEKQKIAARSARIYTDDIDIPIFKKCGVWVAYAEGHMYVSVSFCVSSLLLCVTYMCYWRNKPKKAA